MLGKSGCIERINRRYHQYGGSIYYDGSSMAGNQLTEVIRDKLPKYVTDNCRSISFTRKPGKSQLNHKKLMLQDLSLTFERQIITIPDCEDTKILKSELRFYQLEDDKIHQDTVMALALANYAFVHGQEDEADFTDLLEVFTH